MRHTFSVATFARHRDRVLLIKHKRLNLWLPVGGEMQPGETPLQAAQRELHEETGLQAAYVEAPGAMPGMPPGLLGYEEHPAGDKGVHLNFNFLAEAESDRIRPNHEFEEYRWVQSADACDTPPNVRHLLQQVFCGPARAEQVARAWLAAFNRRALAELLSLYADDATHVTPRRQAPLSGKAAMGAWWEDAFVKLAHLRYELRNVTAAPGRAMLEYARRNPGEPDQMVAELFELNEQGKIRYSHVFIGASENK